MSRFRRIVSVSVLGLGVALTVAMGVAFPIPPALVLVRRRRQDRIELIQPAPAGERIDLEVPVVPARLLER